MQQGLRENWRQFTILILINAFVGGMVGLERSIFPELASTVFKVEGHTALLSFIITFGLVKAIGNYLAGKYTKLFGRKKILIMGWLLGIPVPFLIIYATSWEMIWLANIFLGANQGLAWSTTVLMKIDLVGEKNRGFAMGLNEFAGYISVSAMAFVSSWVAATYGVHPYPFYIGIGLAVMGLLLSVMAVEDTTGVANLEKKTETVPHSKSIFLDTTWRHRNLGSVTQAGFVNNLNDAMAWGIIPVWMHLHGYSISQIGAVAAIYPALWGIGQLFSGKLADMFCKKKVMMYGMLLQGIAILLFPLMPSFTTLIIMSSLLGIGTAMVYPTFLSAIAENTSVKDRPESLGVFRFWRDFGYVAGGLLVGLASDWVGIEFSIEFIGVITVLSAGILAVRMYCPIKTITTTCLQPQ